MNFTWYSCRVRCDSIDMTSLPLGKGHVHSCVFTFTYVYIITCMMYMYISMYNGCSVICINNICNACIHHACHGVHAGIWLRNPFKFLYGVFLWMLLSAPSQYLNACIYMDFAPSWLSQHNQSVKNHTSEQ